MFRAHHLQSALGGKPCIYTFASGFFFLIGVKHLNFQIPEGLVVAVVVVAQQCERERVQMINM